MGDWEDSRSEFFQETYTSDRSVSESVCHGQGHHGGHGVGGRASLPSTTGRGERMQQRTTSLESGTGSRSHGGGVATGSSGGGAAVRGGNVVANGLQHSGGHHRISLTLESRRSGTATTVPIASSTTIDEVGEVTSCLRDPSPLPLPTSSPTRGPEPRVGGRTTEAPGAAQQARGGIIPMGDHSITIDSNHHNHLHQYRAPMPRDDQQGPAKPAGRDLAAAAVTSAVPTAPGGDDGSTSLLLVGRSGMGLGRTPKPRMRAAVQGLEMEDSDQDVEILDFNDENLSTEMEVWRDIKKLKHLPVSLAQKKTLRQQYQKCPKIKMRRSLAVKFWFQRMGHWTSEWWASVRMGCHAVFRPMLSVDRHRGGEMFVVLSLHKLVFLICSAVSLHLLAFLVAPYLFFICNLLNIDYQAVSCSQLLNNTRRESNLIVSALETLDVHDGSEGESPKVTADVPRYFQLPLFYGSFEELPRELRPLNHVPGGRHDDHFYRISSAPSSAMPGTVGAGAADMVSVAQAAYEEHVPLIYACSVLLALIGVAAYFFQRLLSLIKGVVYDQTAETWFKHLFASWNFSLVCHGSKVLRHHSIYKHIKQKIRATTGLAGRRFGGPSPVAGVNHSYNNNSCKNNNPNKAKKAFSGHSGSSEVTSRIGRGFGRACLLMAGRCAGVVVTGLLLVLVASGVHTACSLLTPKNAMKGMLDRGYLVPDSTEAQLRLFFAFLPALLVTLVKLAVPTIARILGHMEGYSFSSRSLVYSCRIFACRALAVFTLIASFLGDRLDLEEGFEGTEAEAAGDDDCWEDKLGLHLILVAAFDLAAEAFLVLLVRLPKVVLTTTLRRRARRPQDCSNKISFDPYEAVVDLAMDLGLLTFGTLYCPVLPALLGVKLCLSYGLRLFHIWVNCSASREIHSASFIQFLFVGLASAMVLFSAMLSVFAVNWVQVSSDCGPFKGPDFLHIADVFSYEIYGSTGGFRNRPHDHGPATRPQTPFPGTPTDGLNSPDYDIPDIVDTGGDWDDDGGGEVHPIDAVDAGAADVSDVLTSSSTWVTYLLVSIIVLLVFILYVSHLKRLSVEKIASELKCQLAITTQEKCYLKSKVKRASSRFTTATTSAVSRQDSNTLDG